jgi:hypothetical protein
MMGIMVPETCRADNKFCNKIQSVASSWPVYSHESIYNQDRHSNQHIYREETLRRLCTLLFSTLHKTPSQKCSLKGLFHQNIQEPREVQISITAHDWGVFNLQYR